MKKPFYFLLCIAVLSLNPLWAEDNSETIKKLNTIKLPKVELKEVTFTEAIHIIHKQVRLQAPGKKGVNFLMNKNVHSDQPITLILHDVSLGSVLDKLCQASGNSMRIEEYCVNFRRAQQ
jgi:hypothetical protein